MDKNQEMPPPYTQTHQGFEYNDPQDPPDYYQADSDQVPLQPGHQPMMYHGAPQHQPYPNVIVQQPMGVFVAGPPPPDHMLTAIFVTLCCFWPTGIFAIKKARQSRNAYLEGDVIKANKYAHFAKNMINVSIIVGIWSIIVTVVVIVLN